MFSLKIKHSGVRMDPHLEQKTTLYYASFHGGWGSERNVNLDGVEDGILHVNREDRHVVYKQDWVYSLRNAKTDQIPVSVKDYLNLSDELPQRLLAISITNKKFQVTDSTILFAFDHPVYGQYDLIQKESRPESSNYVKDGAIYETVVGLLGDNIYWSKEVRLNQEVSD